jgi:hypothetical protein
MGTSSGPFWTLPLASWHPACMADYDRRAWTQLGRAVWSARRRAGHVKTQDWADRVGRSSRMLLGLERGEPVGRETLALIEGALGWADGRCYEILDGVQGPATTEVIPRPEDELVGSNLHPSDFTLEEWTKLWLAAREAAADNPDART